MKWYVRIIIINAKFYYEVNTKNFEKLTCFAVITMYHELNHLLVRWMMISSPQHPFPYFNEKSSPDIMESGDSWEFLNIRGRICAVYDELPNQSFKLIKVKNLGLLNIVDDQIFKLHSDVQRYICESHVYPIPLGIFPAANENVDPSSKVTRAIGCKTIDSEPNKKEKQDTSGIYLLEGEKVLILPCDKRKGI